MSGCYHRETICTTEEKMNTTDTATPAADPGLPDRNDALWRETPADVRGWILAAHGEVSDLAQLFDVLHQLVVDQRHRPAMALANVLLDRMGNLERELGAPDFLNPPPAPARRAGGTAGADG